MAVEDSLDIFGSDPFGRDYLYGLSTGRDGQGLQPPPQGLQLDTRPYDQMQATPRGFTSGLFSDVLGGTLNMPSMPRTGVPALDLLSPNMNLLNRLSFGDVQKTAERISYGEPLATGSGMTLRPKDETIGAALTVAPFAGNAARFGARAGRAGARMVGERIAENVTMGRSSLPSLLAEPKPSLFAVEPSALMPKPQAPVSELGFYSAAEQAAMNLPRNKGTGQSFLNDLMKAPDVKKDELSWIGLDDFLKDKPNVTKQEVQDFIASNKIDLQEVRLGEPPPYDKIRLATLENELSQLKEHPIDAPTFGEEKFNELLKLQNIRDQSTVDSLYSGAEVAIRNAQRAQAAGNKELANKYFLESEMFNTRAEALDLKGLGVPNPTKYSKYQLAGGENYREILLKLPEQNITERTWKVLKADGTPTTGFFTSEEAALKDASYINGTVVEAPPVNYVTGYRSSHWSGDMNVLAHIRVNDRIDADGKKMLLVEEIQSDWHQAGRERGYATRESLEKWYNQNKLENDPAFSDLTSEQIKIAERNRSAGLGGESVPDAPFKDTWYQLSLKRILKYAADNGYERVGLTTGKRQVERFSDELRQNVDQIDFSSGYPNKETTTITATKNGQSTFEGNVVDGKFIDGSARGKTIDEVLGKSIAQKIQSHDPSQGLGTIKGDDLTIGGEGMKKYYDEIYPKFLEKYGKKWDAGVGETKLNVKRDPALKDMTSRPVGIVKSDYGWSLKLKDGSNYGAFSTEESALKKLPEFQKRFDGNGEPIRYIDITPKMKEGVKKGQPLAAAEQAPEMLASGGLDYADPFKNPLLESTIG